MTSAACELWYLRAPATDTPADLALSALTAEERHRALTRPAGPTAVLSTATRIALRTLLGRRLGRAPSEVVLLRRRCPRCAGPHGKPALSAGQGHRLHFSVSHSAGRALLAVAATAVGIDVQGPLSQRTADTCAQALHPLEQQDLSRLEGRHRTIEFARLWTRKEAYLKAVGTGLAHGLRGNYLGSRLALRPSGWTVTDLDTTATHTAAVALALPTAVVPPLREVPAHRLLP
ncbi:4'-phosphopantetheinyl transferase family protein [Streptomyces sp. NPDC058326]|uniref:4'-phosphopantetheinyl transferase family protein n=1 Tax=Streptomyces sp. NPDC058326 TaxID=3346447 RepID=UPI0036F18AD6